MGDFHAARFTAEALDALDKAILNYPPGPAVHHLKRLQAHIRAQARELDEVHAWHHEAAVKVLVQRTRAEIAEAKLAGLHDRVYGLVRSGNDRYTEGWRDAIFAAVALIPKRTK